MAMVVKNNIAAQMVLGELNKNQSKLGKSLEKVASGQKINSAQDDAAGFAISEKMREQVRSLAQDNQNVQNGSSLFKIAEGGINNIVEELRNLKELAINAANDTNTSGDRLTIQKEFQQKMANINDIATMTNYNGIPLLDGRYKMPVTIGSTVDVSSEPDPPTFDSVFKEVDEPTGTTQIISGTNYTIDSDGVYSIAAGFTGTITVNAQNVKLTQADPSTALQEVEIIGPSGGNANLWIENLNIETNTRNSSIISFQYEDNVLTVRGDNILKGIPAGQDADNLGRGYATIYAGQDDGYSDNYTSLNVQGNNSSTLTISNAAGGACIGSNSVIDSRYTGDINIANLNINAYVSTQYQWSSGTAGSVIGPSRDNASGGHVGNITVENSTINANGNLLYIGDENRGMVIGAMGYGNCGDILVVSSTINANKMTGAIGIAKYNTGGYASSQCGNITISDSTVNATNLGNSSELYNATNMGIGIGVTGYTSHANSNLGDIYIYSSTINTSSKYGAGIGSNVPADTNPADIPNITIANGTKITHASEHGAAVGSGLNGIIGNITISRSSYDLLDVSQAYQDDNQPYPGLGNGDNGTCGTVTILDYTTSETVIATIGNPLKIHHGTKANQATNFYLNDMHTKSLGTSDLIDTTKSITDDGYFVKESDEDRYWALSYDKDKQTAWLETLQNAQNQSLDTIDVKTKDHANVAIRVLDGAIEYALDESTRVGAYPQRLEYTDANITTMGENVQSAESTIRDADMAKEMTTYTKNNVLTQAAQSMLAQANQNSSAVLSLLQ